MPNMAAPDQPRPSIDSVYNLLQGLDDNQAEDLLRDLNHTAPSNVPVAEALDFFEGPADNNLSGTTRRRRRSTFLKSVSSFDLRSPSSPSPSSGHRPGGRSPSNLSPSEPTPPLPGSSPPRARSASAVPHEDEEARRQKDQRFKTPRAYKRISRPWATLAPPSSGGPDVRDLLMAYLSGSPASSSSSPSPSLSSSPSSSSSSFSADSPATPRTPAGSSSFYSPVMFSSMDAEPDAPPSLADLLEPSPLRMPKKTAQTPRFAAVVPPPLQLQRGGPDNISGIFEVLSGGS